MSDQKNIERLFQEKFKDFEVSPPSHLWDSIEGELRGDSKRKRRIIPMWYRIAGAAAVLALLLLSGAFLFNAPEFPPSNNPVTDSNKLEFTTPEESSTVQNSENTVNSTEKPEPQSNTAQIASGIKPDPDKNPAKRNSQNILPNKNTVAENNRTSSSSPTAVGYTTVDNALDKLNDQKNNSEGISLTNNTKQPATETETINTSTPSVFPDTMEKSEDIAFSDLTGNKEEDEQEKADKTSPRWSVNPNIAPVYYNSVTNGSPIDPQFADNSKSGDINMSYGFNIAYNISNRLSIRSGVNKVNVGYETEGIQFSPAVSAASMKNVTYTESSSPQLAVTDNNPKNQNNFASTEIASKGNIYEGSMMQRFGYYEIPIEVKYRLINKRFGVNIIGGLSSLLLSDNTITLNSNSLTTRVGEANNVNDVNFSTNIGLGLDYQFSRTLIFNIEPMFKYQLNTFSSDNGGFNPYILGVYTGFSFRF